MSGSHLSKDFFEVVKSIGEAKSKQEEDRIIIQEVARLKCRINDSSSTSNKKKQKEFLVRLMYVEMLGHDAAFGYIKGVELTASTNLMQKRVGYLCCSLVLSPEHEFRFMIINQLQRDLKSSNQLEVCSALTAVCKLVTAEMIPAVLTNVSDLLQHDADLVRKKAVMAIHRFHQLNPESIEDLVGNLRRTLCDKDPSVMGAALSILHDIIKANVGDYKDLVPSFVSILKQIMEHRLPREFDYHRIPAPWIQIRLLKILAILGQADQSASEGMYEVLHDVMRRADTGINVGYAIIYECVRTVTTIYPNTTLLDSAAASISRFISSDNHNLRYLGVTGLAAIVKDHPRYATEHQMAVIDCLEDPDETLKRKTLDLLFRMTNPVNVEFISDKLTQFLRETTDVFLRTELVSKITQNAERYAPSNAWYIQTMTNVFELGGELVPADVAHNLLRLIAEGSGEDDELDMELRKDAVETYLELLDRAVLPDILVHVMSWVLGEYGYLADTMQLDEICERICELADRSFVHPDMTRSYIISAVMKITAQIGRPLPAATALIEKYKKSKSTDLQQRCLEFLALLNDIRTMSEVLPVDASCEDFEADPNMEFLNAFVEQAISNGAQRYAPPADSDDDDDRARGESNRGLNFAAYEKTEVPYVLPKQNIAPTNAPPFGNPNAASHEDQSYSKPRQPVKNVWGPKGLHTNEQPDANSPSQNAPPPGHPSHYPPASNHGPNAPYATGQHPPPGGNYPPQASPYPLGGGPPPPFAQPVPQGRYGAPSHEQYDAGEEEVDSPDEPDERQQMASALFGGLPGASNGKKNAKKPAPRQRKSSGGRKSSKPPMSTAAPAAPVDLLDMSFDSPPIQSSPAPAPDPFGLSPANTLDQFNMSSMSSSLPTGSLIYRSLRNLS